MRGVRERLGEQLAARLARPDGAAGKRLREGRAASAASATPPKSTTATRGAEGPGGGEAPLGEGDRRLALVAGRRAEARQPAPRGEGPLRERQRIDGMANPRRSAVPTSGAAATDLEVAAAAEVDPRRPGLGGEPRDPLAAVGARRAELRRQKSHSPTQDSALIRISTLL